MLYFCIYPPFLSIRFKKYLKETNFSLNSETVIVD